VAPLFIMSRLRDPKVVDALEPDIARCYVDGYETFCEVAKLCTDLGLRRRRLVLRWESVILLSHFKSDYRIYLTVGVER